MKKLTSIIVAAALIAPAALAANSGNRVATPGTESRHEANLSEASAETTSSSSARTYQSATEERATEETQKRRPRAALAGKVNVAARSRNQ